MKIESLGLLVLIMVIAGSISALSLKSDKQIECYDGTQSVATSTNEGEAYYYCPDHLIEKDVKDINTTIITLQDRITALENDKSIMQTKLDKLCQSAKGVC